MLKKQEHFILSYCKKLHPNHSSPTAIGHMAREKGLTSNRYGSPWASPWCLKLTKRGLLHRNDRGHYRITQAGLRALEERKP